MIYFRWNKILEKFVERDSNWILILGSFAVYVCNMERSCMRPLPTSTLVFTSKINLFSWRDVSGDSFFCSFLFSSSLFGQFKIHSVRLRLRLRRDRICAECKSSKHVRCERTTSHSLGCGIAERIIWDSNQRIMLCRMLGSMLNANNGIILFDVIVVGRKWGFVAADTKCVILSPCPIQRQNYHHPANTLKSPPKTLKNKNKKKRIKLKRRKTESYARFDAKNVAFMEWALSKHTYTVNWTANSVHPEQRALR